MEGAKRKILFIWLQFSFFLIYLFIYCYSIFFKKKTKYGEKIAAVWYTPEGAPGSNLRLGKWKEYFLKDGVHYDNFPCYSFKEYVEYFLEGTWSNRYWFYWKLLLRRFRQFFSLRHYDIVWIDRGYIPLYPLSTAFFERCIKKMGLKVIIDTTDGEDYQSNPRLMTDVIQQADVVTVADKYLYEFYSEKHNHVYRINWTIPTENYIVKSNYNFRETLPVIGWMGDPINGFYLEQLSTVLERVAKQHPFILRYMCRVQLRINIPSARIDNFQFDDYYAIIETFDIGICPFLEKNMSNKGKIAMKNQEFMLCAIPQVCSQVAVSEHLVNFESAMIADSEKEWENYLIALIENQNLRQKVGTNSRKIFIENYLYENEFPKLKKALLSPNEME